MIVNLLLYIRNAVTESTLKIETCDIQTRGNDVPQTRNIRKTPFYWGHKSGILYHFILDN